MTIFEVESSAGTNLLDEAFSEAIRQAALQQLLLCMQAGEQKQSASNKARAVHK
jgi:hypothetical protein